MEYRIVEKPAFRFAGVSRRVPMQFEGVNEAIVRLAESITPGQREELHRLRDIAPEEIVMSPGIRTADSGRSGESSLT